MYFVYNYLNATVLCVDFVGLTYFSIYSSLSNIRRVLWHDCVQW